MEQIPVSDVSKWFKMNQRPEWDILQGKNAIFGFDGVDDFDKSLAELETTLQELPAGNYNIRAKKVKAPNSAFRQISFNVPVVSSKPVNRMSTEAEFKARLESELEKEKLKLQFEFQVKRDIEKIQENQAKLENKIEEILNILEDLFDGNESNDNKAKADLSTLIKKGAEIAESGNALAKTFLKK